MNNIKKKVIILVSVCLIVLALAFIYDKFLTKSYFNELKLDEVIEKIENKDSFILVVSQTTCSHCQEYKPRITKIANKYKLNIYYIEVNLLSKEEDKEFKKYVSYGGSTPTTVFIKDGYQETTATNIIGSGLSEDKIVDKFKSNGFIK